MRRLYIRLFGVALVHAFILYSSSILAAALPIPTQEEFGDFLLEPWKPGAPVLVVFKDPFCHYCLRALERREELKKFNAFLFWYPIFGELSEKRVAEIFQCGSPVSNIVITAVLAKRSPACAGSVNKKQLQLNSRMFDAYSPSGVPAYYYAGVKTTVAGMASRVDAANAVIVPAVKLDWQRYRNNQIIQSTAGKIKAAAVISRSASTKLNLHTIMEKVSAFGVYDWYLFVADSNEYLRVCKQLVGGCGSENVQKNAETVGEIQLLFGILDDDDLNYIINGKLVPHL